MRALVISAYSPGLTAASVNGMMRRLGVFLAAVSDVATAIEILFFGHPGEIEALGGQDAVDAAQSARFGCPVTVRLVPLAQRRETAWSHYGAGILSAFDQPGFYHYAGGPQVAAVAASLARRPDLVFISRLTAMGAVLRSGARPARMFFDLDDLEHRVRLRTVLQRPIWPSKLLYLLQIPALVLAERRAAALCERMFVCSDRDRRDLRRLGFGAHVTVVPNAITVPPVAAPLGPRSVLFLGSYNYRPNLDAAARLISRIWPLVRRIVPDARLLIAGAHADQIPGFAHPPAGVTFSGFVADLDVLYARSRVIACPITVGGGTRVKLIEAAAYGKAMVSTRIGAEGLDFDDGREIVLTDTDEGMAEACGWLLLDDAACAAMGAAARTKAVALYDAAAVQRNVAAMLGCELGTV